VIWVSRLRGLGVDRGRVGANDTGAKGREMGRGWWGNLSELLAGVGRGRVGANDTGAKGGEEGRGFFLY